MENDLTKHCQLFENQIYSIDVGTNCALTGNRPAFKSKCPDIKFGNKYEEKIKEINIEHHLIKEQKR